MPRLSAIPQASVTSVTGVTGSEGVTTPAELRRLAARVRRLAPSHRDPERFHLDKSEIAAELRRLAKEIAA